MSLWENIIKFVDSGGFIILRRIGIVVIVCGFLLAFIFEQTGNMSNFTSKVAYWVAAIGMIIIILVYATATLAVILRIFGLF